MSAPSNVKGWVVDVIGETIFPAEVVYRGGKILSIRQARESECHQYIMPGLVDAHVHIESSLLPPREFARLAVVHGTVATVSDPHEIANVLGVSGVRYMLERLANCPLKVCFGAPSCVPATNFETAGGKISAADVSMLLDDPRIHYLAEVMNFPGILADDPELLAMIASAKKCGKPVDGHAPGLRGEDAARYAAAGITTDHECFTEAEARDKIAAGMSIIIREGSAAKNFEALIGLLEEFPERIMFGTDDAHPDYLLSGHINLQVKRALAKGINFFKVIRAATLNPIVHYNLPVGLLREGDPADFIVVNNLEEFEIERTVIGGVEVANRGRAQFNSLPAPVINNFNRELLGLDDLRIESVGCEHLRVIGIVPGQLVSEELILPCKLNEGELILSDPGNDILKLVVVNRYDPDAAPALAFVKGFNLQEGAIASTVAHDSHNIIAVGVSDEDILQAINMVIGARGGLSVANGSVEHLLPLPIAGLMSGSDGHSVARLYSEMDRYTKSVMGSLLPAPFMTLSFLALPVIPSLKLTDLGLFDGDNFRFVDVQKS